MTYDTQCTALKISPTRYIRRVASKDNSTHLFCVVVLTCWRPAFLIKLDFIFLSKNWNPTMSKLPAATNTCKLAYFTSRSCLLSSQFCVSVVFEILGRYQSYQSNGTLITRNWEKTQFLLSTVITLNLFHYHRRETDWDPLLISRCDAALLRRNLGQTTASESQRIVLPCLCTKDLFSLPFRFCEYLKSFYLRF